MIEYWRSQLLAQYKKHYDALRDAVRSQKHSVDFPKAQVDVDAFYKLYSCLMWDHPELYSISPQYAAMFGPFSFTVKLSYLYDVQRKCEIDQSLERMKAEMKKSTGQTIDKIYQAIFLLVNDSRYEIDNAYNQNAASVIHFHRAQCSGFAAAFKYVMDTLGIWCIIVSGSALSGSQRSPHGWNIVNLDGRYHHVDITQFAVKPLTGADQLRSYLVFESDAERKARGCLWDFAATPACSVWEAPVLPPQRSQQKAPPAANVPVYTRLFDVQAKIAECMKNQVTYFAFALMIPMYSNEKLVRMIMNIISELGNNEQTSFSYEVGFKEYFYVKFNYSL